MKRSVTSKGTAHTRAPSQRSLVFLVCLLWFNVGILNTSVAWTLHSLLESLHFNVAGATLLTSSFALGRCLGPVVLTYSLDLVGRRPTILISVGMGTVCQILVCAAACAEAPTIVFVALRLFLGMCTGGTTVCTKTYLFEFLPANKERDKWVNFVHIALQVGSIAFTVSLAGIRTQPSWWAITLGTALPGLALMMVLRHCECFPESPEFLADRGDFVQAADVAGAVAEQSDISFDRATYIRTSRKERSSATKSIDSAGAISELLRPPFLFVVIVLLSTTALHKFAQQVNATWGMNWLELTGRTDQKYGVGVFKFCAKIAGGLTAAYAQRQIGILPLLVFGYITCAVGSVAFANVEGSGWLLHSSLGLAYFGEEISNVLAMSVVIQSFPSRLRGRGSSLAAAPSCFAGLLAGMMAAKPESAFYFSGAAMIMASFVQLLGTLIRTQRVSSKAD